jgi:hypothetical protein
LQGTDFAAVSQRLPQYLDELTCRSGTDGRTHKTHLRVRAGYYTRHSLLGGWAELGKALALCGSRDDETAKRRQQPRTAEVK